MNVDRILFLSLIFISSIASTSLAQEKFQKSVSLSFESGPLISNGKPWADEVKNSVEYRGIDAKFSWRKISNTHMNHLYRYPTFGVGFTSLLGDFPEIGRPQAFYGFFEMPFLYKSKGQKLSFGYFSQIGLGFNLSPYDSINNPNNQYIGSSLNAYIHFGFRGEYQLSDRILIISDIGMKHYSNGAIKKPNAGINLIPFSLGVKSYLGKVNQTPTTLPVYPDLDKRWFLNIALYTGFKNYEIGDRNYFRGGLGVNYLWEANYKFRLGLGLDLFYAPGMSERNNEEQFSFRDQTSLAVVASWEWKLTEKLFMPVGFGVYLYRNELNQEISVFYERIGFRYRMTEALSAGLQIKAHKAKADFFEFTLGYTILGRVRYQTSK
ncbi:MAG: hypothetical protein ACI9UV_002323 [Algoriphagus sp.]|jgi:hypothetical protein